MSINIQLEGGLKKLSGQTMTKEKIVEKLGYTPAKKEEVGASLAALNSDIEAIEDKIENIDPDSSDNEFVLADKQGNVIAKIDDEGLHTTSIEAESFISNDKELAVYDENGNAAFKVDENGVTYAAELTAKKLMLGSEDVDSKFTALASDLAGHKGDSTHVTAEEKKTWNAKSDFSGKYSDLEGAPNINDDDDSSESISVEDKNGNVIFKIDSEGAHTTKLELLSGDVDTQLDNINADLARHKDGTNEANDPIHIQPDERAKWNAKVDDEDLEKLSKEIISDSEEFAIADKDGNIAARVNEVGEFEAASVRAKKLFLGDDEKDVAERFTEVEANIAALDMDTTKTFEDLTILVTGHIDETNNPHVVTKEQIGLGNVDNTSDIDKPVSIATQEAINMHAFDTDNPHMINKIHVGLGNVNNTSDLNKPISKATQRAINDLNNIDYSLIVFDTSWIIPESAESQSIVDIARVGYARVGHI